ncbi:MAG: hypothetical protein SGILL_008544 [Bacillariaceae sp.]
MSWKQRIRSRGGRHGRSSYSRRAPATGGCMFCEGLDEALSGHTRKQCPIFRQLKSQTSSTPYIATHLKPSEAEGYAAAGVLPWKRSKSGEIEILLTREYRNPNQDRGGDKLNFLGGKRLKRETDALSCAVDKIDQESAGMLGRATLVHMREGCPIVCWSSDSKYVLFVYELVGVDDCEIDIRCAGLSGAKRLEWATRRELMSSLWRRQEMHPFAIEILERLTTCSIMKHLEELFDVAYAPPSARKPPQEDEEENEAVARHFDVAGAIRATLEVARPESRLLNSPPMVESYSYIWLQAAVQDTPRRDQKKLCLRFHPDRLSRALQHPPSDEESSMATRAMQVLNGLIDGSFETDVVNCLKELDQFRARIVGSDTSSSKDGLKNVEDLLADLTINGSHGR